MAKEMPKKLIRVTFVLNGSLFLLSGLDFIDRGEMLFGVIQMAIGIVNLLLLRFNRMRMGLSIDQIAYVLNIIVCIIVTIDYFKQGKTYIQYAWLLATIISGMALITSLSKSRDLSSHKS